MRVICSAVAVASLVAAIFLATNSSASAHEHRTILNGKYELVVGLLNEPAVSDELNSLDLRVSDVSQATPTSDEDAAVGTPVEGLESTLKVDIIFGDQTQTLTLEPRWQTPGAYNAWLIPVQPGDYSFHVTGTINGESVDETFTPGPETFSSVTDRATLEFPKQSASHQPAIGAIADSGSGYFGGELLAGIAALVAIAALALRMCSGLLSNRRFPAGASAGD
jgi:hypothetical protein